MPHTFALRKAVVLKIPPSKGENNFFHLQGAFITNYSHTAIHESQINVISEGDAGSINPAVHDVLNI